MRGNAVSIKGNVTRDAEARRTQSGNTSVSFGLAWSQSRKAQDGSGYEDVPHYFDVECWMTDGQLNAVLPQIVKGAGCAIVDGHVEYQHWLDGQGNKRSKVVLRVDDPISGLLLTAPRVQVRQQQGGYAYGGGNAPQNAPQQSQGGYQQVQPTQQARQYQQQAQAAPQYSPASQGFDASDIYADDSIPF